MQSLVATDVHVAYATRPVLAGVDLRASPGQRVGIVGDNGSGKSTLLRVLAGEQHPDSGTVHRPDDLVHLHQDPVFAPESTVGSVLDAALAPLHDAVREVQRLGEALADGTGTGAYDAALTWAQDHDAWDADRRALLAAEHLGVSGLARERPMAELSGGQRRRVAMAAALTRRPACLLLDEPTNHLDDAGVELVERTCVDLPGVVVVVSHDRVLLNRVCTHLVDLDPGGTRYTGGFSDYLTEKAAARARWDQDFAEQQEEIDRLRTATHVRHRDVAAGRGPRDNDKFVTKFKGSRVDKAVSRRVHAAERQLEAAERDALGKPPPVLRMRAPLTGHGAAVRVRGLVVADRLRLDSLDVEAGGQLLVTGSNGSGKSTLLGVLAGRVPATAGVVEVGGRVGLLAQDTRVREPRESARQAYARAVGPDLAERVPLRSLGLLSPASHTTPVGALSTGQQRRLALAILLSDPPDLLLLDEPTNHLSLALVSELEDALSTTTGTVIVASHDRWLRGRWSGAVTLLSSDSRR